MHGSLCAPTYEQSHEPSQHSSGQPKHARGGGGIVSGATGCGVFLCQLRLCCLFARETMSGTDGAGCAAAGDAITSSAATSVFMLLALSAIVGRGALP